jgi:hypothetical protein
MSNKRTAEESLPLGCPRQLLSAQRTRVQLANWPVFPSFLIGIIGPTSHGSDLAPPLVIGRRHHVSKGAMTRTNFVNRSAFRVGAVGRLVYGFVRSQIDCLAALWRVLSTTYTRRNDIQEEVW